MPELNQLKRTNDSGSVVNLASISSCDSACFAEGRRDRSYLVLSESLTFFILIYYHFFFTLFLEFYSYNLISQKSFLGCLQMLFV